jgi:PAS domain S-box-containing protein
VSENSTTAAPTTSEVVEELLRQLVDARFVLTDRDGAVTRWSRPAEELFGWPGARMLGRALPETLAMTEALPRNGGVLQTTVRRKNGSELEVTLTLVPVGMSQSLEFNGFLEALEIAAPRGNALQQLQQSHRTVVDWIHAALRGEARLEDDDLAAGTIVAFRPLVEPPPPPPTVEDDEHPYTELELNAADEAAAYLEFDTSRIDAVEELGERLATELGEARGALAELRSAVDKLAEAPQEDDEQLLTTVAALEATVARVEQLEADDTQRRLAAELAELSERVSAGDDAAAAERVRERLDELERSLGAGGERDRSLRQALHEMSARVDELARERADAEAETEERSKTEAERDEKLRRELDATRAKLEAIAGERIEEQRTLAGELAETHAKLEALERAMGDEHERADEARERLAELGHELAELRSAPPAAPSPGAEPASAAAAEAAGEALKAIERLTARAEQAADAARSHSSRAYDASGAAEARASRAEEAAAAAEAQAGRAAESIAGVEERSERAERAVAGMQAQALAARQAAESVQQRAQEARLALETVEQHSSQAREIATAVETQAGRAGEAESAAEAHAQRAEGAVSKLDEHVRRAEEAAAAARAEGEQLLAAAAEVHAAAERAADIQARTEAQAARVEESMSQVERGAIRAEAAAASAAGDAERTGEEAGRLAEIAAVAEQQAELARQAAEAAAEAAGAARAAANEAEAAGHRSRESERPLVRFDAAPNGQTAANGNGHDPRRPLFAKRDSGPARPPRPGFDDAPHPMATIALDGHFKELNPAFTDLVGYSEADFAAAVWPPVMDRANLQTHREQMKAMLAGTIESAEVKTGYVHAQGLLVPVVGSIRLVREDGEPSHFLLQAAGR